MAGISSVCPLPYRWASTCMMGTSSTLGTSSWKLSMFPDTLPAAWSIIAQPNTACFPAMFFSKEVSDAPICPEGTSTSSLSTYAAACSRCPMRPSSTPGTERLQPSASKKQKTLSSETEKKDGKKLKSASSGFSRQPTDRQTCKTFRQLFSPAEALSVSRNETGCGLKIFTKTN